jgi:hypothetical protein
VPVLHPVLVVSITESAFVCEAALGSGVSLASTWPQPSSRSRGTGTTCVMLSTQASWRAGHRFAPARLSGYVLTTQSR